jgi:hypothetical protein
MAHTHAAAQVFASMSVRHAEQTETAQLADGVLQALLQGQEPVLSFPCALLDNSHLARKKIEAMQSKMEVDATDYVTIQDVAADSTRPPHGQRGQQDACHQGLQVSQTLVR